MAMAEYKREKIGTIIVDNSRVRLASRYRGVGLVGGCLIGTVKHSTRAGVRWICVKLMIGSYS